jgi:hypothetical protein
MSDEAWSLTWACLWCAIALFLGAIAWVEWRARAEEAAIAEDYEDGTPPGEPPIAVTEPACENVM